MYHLISIDFKAKMLNMYLFYPHFMQILIERSISSSIPQLIIDQLRVIIKLH